MLHTCPHAEACAGCPQIGRSDAEQARAKATRVGKALARFPGLAAVPIEPVNRPAPDQEVGYRTRAKLVVGPGPRLGLYAKTGDHVVVDIPECRVLTPSLHAVAAAIRSSLAEPGAVLRAPALRAIDLREALAPDGALRVLVTFVLDAGAAIPSSALGAAAEALAARAPSVATLAVSVQEVGSPQVLGRDLRVLVGPAGLPDVLAPGAPLFAHATPGGFVQVHRGQAARLRAFVAEALGELAGRTVVDAFAGSGATGIALAARGAEVVALEAHAPSAEAARTAAAAQSLALDVRAADVADGLEALAREGRTVDAIVLNPPRRGVSPRARAAAARLARTAIAYVSCDPDTLARDLDHLVRLGWASGALVPFDLIPQTDEVETVAILRRQGPPAPVVLWADEALVAVDKPAHQPTVGAASLVERLRALPGLGEVVALAPLDAGTSGVCLFARTPRAAPALLRALAAPEAVAEWEALCKGTTPADRPVPPARLHRVALVGGHSLVTLRAPPTGTRALRRALARAGHPILGDEKDGHAPSNRHLLERHALDRPFLHGAGVHLEHPRTGAPIDLAAPRPGELQLVLDRLAGA